jgi:hypothetical protein
VNYVENFRAQLAPYRTVSLLQFQNIRTGFVAKVSASVGRVENYRTWNPLRTFLFSYNILFTRKYPESKMNS